MLISDWSSDVCSSDLTATTVHVVDDAADFFLGQRLVDDRQRHALGQHFRQQGAAGGGLDEVIELLALLFGVIEQADLDLRSEEHTSELQSLMRISYAVFCLKKKQQNQLNT